jgi:hypothetical protein
MQTVYKLNADELNNEFLESIKALFPHKTIEVAIHELDDENQSPPTAGLQRAKFSPFPARLKLTRDELHDRRPDYLTLPVDEIVMPFRDERYER